MDYYEVVRIVNVSLAGVTALLALAKAPRLWPLMHFPARLMYTGFVALLVSAAYGTAEAMIIGLEPGLRTSFTGAALILAFLAFVWPDRSIGWMSKKSR